MSIAPKREYINRCTSGETTGEYVSLESARQAAADCLKWTTAVVISRRTDDRFDEPVETICR